MTKATEKFISLTSDFSIASEGVGVMKGTIIKFCPEAKIVDLSHGIADYNIKEGANILEAVEFLPVGCHICVVDPGVGTNRKGIAIATARGDFLIGPDNGVLMPAAEILGGIKKAVSLTNEKYQQTPISPIFHGRDIFSPAAAYLASGIAIDDLGKEIKPEELKPAPYDFGKVSNENVLGEVLQINKFGNLTTNIKADLLKEIGIEEGGIVSLKIGNLELEVHFKKTFGDVSEGEVIMISNEYRKLEIALNQASFAKKYQVEFGERVEISKS